MFLSLPLISYDGRHRDVVGVGPPGCQGDRTQFRPDPPSNQSGVDSKVLDGSSDTGSFR